jgi:DNA-binding MarR family transcriptional regulator
MEHDRPIEAIETELTVLGRTLDLMARRADLFEGLDRASYLILRALDEMGPAGINAIASRLGLDGSTVTRQAAAMVRRSLVERRQDPADRRYSILAVTPEGRALMASLRATRRRRLADLLHGWTPEDVELLGRMLGKLNLSIAASLASGQLLEGGAGRRLS